jgi:hypothetical protein
MVFPLIFNALGRSRDRSLPSYWHDFFCTIPDKGLLLQHQTPLEASAVGMLLREVEDILVRAREQAARPRAKQLTDNPGNISLASEERQVRCRATTLPIKLFFFDMT